MKTLKDFEIGHHCNPDLIRQEAINWIKEMQEKDIDINSPIDCLMKFFNIKESEMK